MFRALSLPVHAVSASEKDFVLRTLPRFATICLLGAAALLPACSSTDAPTSDTPVSRGEKVFLGDSACDSCHTATGKGKEGPNITMSKTAGIGNWTYQQFYDAVRNQKRNDGTMLCQLMTKFSVTEITDAQMQDLYAYIGSLPVSDVVNKGSYCP